MWLSNFMVLIAVCLVVNSRGVIGTLDDEQEECAACTKGSCRSINGIYTRPDLPPGYSLVAQIPAGSCNVLAQQMKHTRNLLALKYTNGSYIMNGDWKFINSREFHGASTKFIYVHQDDDSLETLTSPGPLAASVDIMVVNYQPNLGIKYGYSFPITPVLAPPSIQRTSIEPSVVGTKRLNANLNSTLQRDEAKPSLISPHRRPRVRRKYYHWKITGLTACSKSCGGGIQAYVTTCVKEISPHNQTPVHERRCAHLDSQPPSPIPCNTEACPPSWQYYWGQCSVTCNEGVQQLIPQCKETEDIQVNENLCPRPKPAVQTRPCRERTCDHQNENEVLHAVYSDRENWSVGSWSDCSVSCGTGHRSRSVTCPSGRCGPEDRPVHAEYCNSSPCVSPIPSRSLVQPSQSITAWLATEWSQCSESCGTGNQTRLVICGIEDQSRCPADSRPDPFRGCSSDKQCGGEWFIGPWGSCSSSCSGRSRQKREVLCIVKIRDNLHITNEMTCTADLKPADEQFCDGVCPPYWYIGDWGSCEGSCPTGVQRRQVVCLDVNGRPSESCQDDMPVTKRTCACQSKRENSSRERYHPVQDEPLDRSCVDRIRKCKVAVQARLCNYPYYTKHCCESCRRTQDLLE